MKVRKKYWVAVLSAFLSLSLVFPYCCHADKSTSSKNHEMVCQSLQSQHHEVAKCKCGHELSKDFQKNKPTSGFLALPVVFTGGFANSIITPENVLSKSFWTSINIREWYQPPIHLLNSVFLH